MFFPHSQKVPFSTFMFTFLKTLTKIQRCEKLFAPFYFMYFMFQIVKISDEDNPE